MRTHTDPCPPARHAPGLPYPPWFPGAGPLRAPSLQHQAQPPTICQARGEQTLTPLPGLPSLGDDSTASGTSTVSGPARLQGPHATCTHVYMYSHTHACTHTMHAHTHKQACTQACTHLTAHACILGFGLRHSTAHSPHILGSRQTCSRPQGDALPHPGSSPCGKVNDIPKRRGCGFWGGAGLRVAWEWKEHLGTSLNSQQVCPL